MGLIGGTVQGVANVGASVIQGEYNKAEAQKNRDFQERMSNTAIQRQIADARAAGISPSMLFGGGASGGASSPHGNSANIDKPNSDIIGVINALSNAARREEQQDFNNKKLEIESRYKNVKGHESSVNADYIKEKTNHLKNYNNSNRNYTDRKYSKKDLESLYTKY